MSKSKTYGPLLSTARWIIFSIWLLEFFGYVLMFLMQATQQGIKPAEANEAAWTVGYILGPVILAFGSFHLGPNAEANLTADAGRRMRTSQLVMTIALTVPTHLLVLIYFWLNVWGKDFDFPAAADDSYMGAVNHGFKLLLFLGAMPIVAVNYLLGRTDVALGSQPQTESAK